MKDIFIDDFSSQTFQAAYRRYCAEMGFGVKNWEVVFQKMNHDPHGKDYAYLRLTDSGETVGFLRFTALEVSSWFFQTKIGFIREFWVAPQHRNSSHGAALLELTESWFVRSGFPASILTTQTADHFYEKHGYVRTEAIAADNEERVYLKRL